MAYNNRSQGLTQVQGPAPVVYYTAPAVENQTVADNNLWPHYDTHSSAGFGVAQIIVGLISIAGGILAFVSEAELCDVGIGIWAGIFYLIAGSITNAAGKYPKSSLIIATMVCSVFNILFGVAEITVASVALEENDCYKYTLGNFYDCFNQYEIQFSANCIMIGAGALQILLGFAMMIICGVAIDKSSKVQPVNIPVTYAQHQPQPVFIQGPSAFQHQPQPQSPPHYVQQQYPKHQANKR